MDKRHRLRLLSLAGILALVATSSASGDDDAPLATLPYRPLWMLVNPEGLPEEYETEISFRVTASGEALPPEDLEIHIEFQDQKIPLHVGEQGQLRLPQNKEWADGNATIVANQPKGSMTALFGIRFTGTREIEGGEMRYRDLTVGLDVVRGILPSVTALTGHKVDDSSIALRFQVDDNKGDKRDIIVHSEEGEIVYRANEDGLITIPYDYRLFEQNPTINAPAGHYTLDFNAGSTEVDNQRTKPKPKPEE